MKNLIKIITITAITLFFINCSSPMQPEELLGADTTKCECK